MTRSLNLAEESLTFSVLRATHFWPAVATGALSTAALAALAVAGVRVEGSLADMLARTIYGIALLGHCFLFDDGAQSLTRATRSGWSTIAAIRVAVGLVLLAVVVSVQGGLMEVLSPGFPQLKMVVEPAALGLWTWAVAVIAGHRQADGSGWPVAAPFLALAMITISRLPEAVVLFADHDTSAFDASRVRWLAVALAASILLMLELRANR